MYLLQGRAATPEADRAATSSLVDRVADTGQPALRVWRPHEQVAFGRRDATREGYDQALDIARDRGLAVTERAVGGHAVVFTGSTAAFVRAEPVEESRTGIQHRYDEAIGDASDALRELGVDPREGEPEGAFCPGTHSLSASGKIVGLAQRVRRDVATVAGIVVVRDHERIAAVLDPVYDALSLPFERDAVGSILRAGGDGSPDAVIASLRDSLGDGPTTVETVRET